MNIDNFILIQVYILHFLTIADSRDRVELVSAENMKTETVPQYSSDNGLLQGGGKICKFVHQYSKGKIISKNMDTLMETGHGCMVTRN